MTNLDFKKIRKSNTSLNAV